MNDIVTALSLQAWKPVVNALILPPLPFLLMVLIGARLMFNRRLIAWLLITFGVAMIWFTSTTAAGKLLRPVLMDIPPALNAQAVAELKASAGPNTAIVVMGGGRIGFAPEYGVSTLSPLSMERLRYGLWIGRQTGLPVAYTGGLGHGSPPGTTEADIAIQIAEREFGYPLRWAEGRSRDTSESGLLTVPELQSAGVTRIVLVTTDLHMPRALRAFKRGAERSGKPLTLLPAPIGIPKHYDWSWADFLPTSRGMVDSRILIHEWLGYWLGA